MIEQATGTVLRIEERAVCLTVDKLTWRFLVPNGHIYQVASEESLYVHMHWNQEQGPSLFGFKREIERTLFCSIISCSGIGPRIALAILGDLGAEGFLAALQDGNSKALSTVNGIGPKKAEQIIMQLRHKTEKLIAAHPSEKVGIAPSSWQLVREALESLNYSRPEITRALERIRTDDAVTSGSFDQLMRSALAHLAKQP